MAQAQHRRGQPVGPVAAVVVEQPGLDQRLREAADRRAREAGALRDLAVAQQVGTGPEGPQDLDAPHQGTVQQRVFMVLAPWRAVGRSVHGAWTGVPAKPISNSTQWKCGDARRRPRP